LPANKNKYLQLFEDTGEVNFTPIYMAGIVSHQRAYRLCWQLNKVLGIELARTEDLFYQHPKNGDTYIQCFEYANEEYNIIYRLVGNKTTGALLSAEHKNTGFFLLVKAEMGEEEWNKLLVSLKKVTFAATIYNIQVASLKNADILYF
jgi:hypothetical protein